MRFLLVLGLLIVCIVLIAVLMTEAERALGFECRESMTLGVPVCVSKEQKS